MWQAKLFGSLPMLLDFVNGHALEHHQFKIVVVPARIWQRRSSPRYYLIYRLQAPEGEPAGTAEAAALATEEAAAISTASEIIASAQQRGQQGPGGSGA